MTFFSQKDEYPNQDLKWVYPEYTSSVNCLKVINVIKTHL